MKSRIKRLWDYFKELQNEESSLINKNGFIHFLLIFGSVHLVFLFCIILFSAIAFYANQPISKIQIILSTLLSFIFIIIGAKVYFPKLYIKVALTIFLLSITLFVGSCTLAGHFYDLSYDGQSYHQDLIIKLSEGWNPFYQHLSNQDLAIASILNYYPKTAEIYETALYKITNHIEYSKAFNIILTYVAFILVLALLLSLTKVNNIVAVALSLLLILNPVVITEAISFYIDGQVYQLLLSLIALSIMIYFDKRSYILIPFFAVINLLVTIKITALAYTGILIGILLIFTWYSEKIHLSARVFLTAIFATLLGFIFIGFNPFLTNTYYYGHPLHPAMGKYSLDYVEINGPQNFQGQNSLSLLFYSIFSESDFLKGNGKFAHLKIPFHINQREIEAFTSTDPIEGGFGPLFGGAIILTLSLFTYAIICKRTRITNIYLILTILVLSTCLVNSASFYSRFIPQFWIVPCLAILLGLSLKSYLTKILAISIFIVLIINNVFIAKVNWGVNLQGSNLIRSQLSTLAKISNKQSLKVNFGIFESNRIRFKEAGINFIEEKNGLECVDKRRLLSKVIPESVIATCTTPYLVNQII